jgi:hypothetical protein
VGVYVEPPQHVVGLYRPATHYVWRSQPVGRPVRAWRHRSSPSWSARWPSTYWCY